MSDDTEAPPLDQRQTAALSYMLIPLAFTVLFDINRERRSAWARAHARHALLFGAVSFMLLLVVAAIPLCIITFGKFSDSSILTMYGFSFCVDLALLIAVLSYAVRAARTAARGDRSRFG